MFSVVCCIQLSFHFSILFIFLFAFTCQKLYFFFKFFNLINVISLFNFIVGRFSPQLFYFFVLNAHSSVVRVYLPFVEKIHSLFSLFSYLLFFNNIFTLNFMRSKFVILCVLHNSCENFFLHTYIGVTSKTF
jgi:hypothetical protein